MLTPAFNFDNWFNTSIKNIGSFKLLIEVNKLNDFTAECWTMVSENFFFLLK